MKKISFILFILFSVNSYGNLDSIYFKANEKYQAGEYEAAIELYNQVEEMGYESATLYYNLGNAYFRSNKIGKARLYYEKSLKLNPRNDDARQNLIFSENLLVDKIEDMPEIFIRQWVRSIISVANSDSWALVSMISFVVALFLFTVYLLIRSISLRKYGFYGGLVFILVSAMSFVFSWQQMQNEFDPSTAVVVESLVNVKSTPRETGTDLFVLHEGAKVWLEDAAADWQEIRLSDGRKGWLHSSSIEKI